MDFLTLMFGTFGFIEVFVICKLGKVCLGVSELTCLLFALSLAKNKYALC